MLLLLLLLYEGSTTFVQLLRDAIDAKTREPSVPVSTSTGPDPDKPSAPSESALVPLARADEDEMMEDVAEMAGGGQVLGQDALANLETTLSPVEKYAVRFLEEVSIVKVFMLQLCTAMLLTACMLFTLQCSCKSAAIYTVFAAICVAQLVKDVAAMW